MKQRELKLLPGRGSGDLGPGRPDSPGERLVRRRAHQGAALSAGSRTATLESDRSSSRRRQIRRFATIDSAARFLRRLGIDSFVVDMADSISFAADAPVAMSPEGDAVAIGGAGRGAEEDAGADPEGSSLPTPASGTYDA